MGAVGKRRALRADAPVVAHLNRLTEEIAGSKNRYFILRSNIGYLKELTNSITLMDIVVASRFHGIVISYLANKPVLGIAYASKTRDLMSQMGQGEYSLDIFPFDLPTLQRTFVAIESGMRVIKSEISTMLTVHREALAKQYERVFELVRPRPGEIL